MHSFVNVLKRNLNVKMQELDGVELNILQFSLQASAIYEKSLNELKTFTLCYRFSSEQEEIDFFKELKPKLFCHLIYHSKVYNVEINRPTGFDDVQKDYLNKELFSIHDYQSKRLDFYRYYRSGHTHFDNIYFLRGKEVIESYRDIFNFERDPAFSTYADFKVAKILANDMLEIYIKTELDKLENKRNRNLDLPLEKPTWTSKKNYLVELIYAMNEDGCFNNGNISLAQLTNYFSTAFNVDLGYISRNFNDMKIRNNPTPYLDQLKVNYLKKVNCTSTKRDNQS